MLASYFHVILISHWQGKRRVREKVPQHHVTNQLDGSYTQRFQARELKVQRMPIAE